MSQNIEELVAKTARTLDKIDAYRNQVNHAFSWVEAELSNKENTQEKTQKLEAAKKQLLLTKEFLDKEEKSFKSQIKDQDFGIILDVAEVIRKF